MTIYKYIAGKKSIRQRQDHLFFNWMGESKRFAFSCAKRKKNYNRFMDLIQYSFEKYHNTEILQLKLS